jgi:hypothetical protein
MNGQFKNKGSNVSFKQSTAGGGGEAFAFLRIGRIDSVTQRSCFLKLSVFPSLIIMP